jgi:hypothetical protein
MPTQADNPAVAKAKQLLQSVFGYEEFRPEKTRDRP